MRPLFGPTCPLSAHKSEDLENARINHPHSVNLDQSILLPARRCRHAFLAALEVGAVERLDRCGRCAGIRHFDKAEALGLAGELVGDNRDALDRAGLGEEVFQILIGD